MTRRRVAVLGVDAVTALGDDLAASFGALTAGVSRFVPLDRFPDHGTKACAAALLGGGQAPTLAQLVEAVTTAAMGPQARSLGIDRAYFAGSPDFPVPPPGPGVTRRGTGSAVQTWDRVYTGACVASSSALGHAAAAVAAGWADAVLVVTARRLDIGTVRTFAAAGAMTTQPVSRPFTDARSGVLLGDGAAAFVLVAAEEFPERRPLAEIRGWGWGGDGHHAYQPEPSGRGTVRAICAALDVAGLKPGDIGQVSVHGTGTALGDAAEAAALGCVFDEAASLPPVYAPKAAVGHTLEAAGLVEAALALAAVRSQTLPPSLGMRAQDVPLVESVTRVPVVVQRLHHVLCLNQALGGANTALVISDWQDGPAPRQAVRQGPSPSVLAWAPPTVVEPPPLAGFIDSAFPRLVHDAGSRCLAAAELSERERAATAVLLLAPEGDRATRESVRRHGEGNRRLPTPLFIQSTLSSVLGRLAQDVGLQGPVDALASAVPLTDASTLALVHEALIAQRSRAALVIRHIPAPNGGAGTAEAALYG